MSKRTKEFIRDNWKWIALCTSSVALGIIKVAIDSTDNTNEEELSVSIENSSKTQDVRPEPGTTYWNKNAHNWEIDGKPYTYSVRYIDCRDGMFCEKNYSDVDNGYEDYLYYKKQWWTKDIEWLHVQPKD